MQDAHLEHERENLLTKSFLDEWGGLRIWANEHVTRPLLCITPPTWKMLESVMWPSKRAAEFWKRGLMTLRA